MNDKLIQITGCEVCGNTNFDKVLDLGSHPLCDDLIPVNSHEVCQEYPIEIAFCSRCNTALQLFQVPKKTLFPDTYHYRARFTADVLSGMKSLVDSCEKKFGSLVNKTVLDVGCNDGSLLNYFKEKGARTIGVEPTLAFKEAEANGHITYNDYFSESLATELHSEFDNIDFITFTNVFAHIEDLPALLKSLKKVIGPKTVIIIENHYLTPVLDKMQFDTFYHEHPRTYSFTSFLFIAKTLGMQLLDVEFPSRYGGNIRVYIGGQELNPLIDKQTLDKIKLVEGELKNKFSLVSKNISLWRSKKQEKLSNLFSQYGKLKAKAFPGRAAILIKLLNIDHTTISAVYEKPGSLKIGHYVPGTRIPILSDNELFKDTDVDSPIINLAWHIATEINKYLQDSGYQGEIIDVLHPDDYKLK
jgi:SAM-dependent methyltransferase